LKGIREEGRLQTSEKKKGKSLRGGKYISGGCKKHTILTSYVQQVPAAVKVVEKESESGPARRVTAR